MPQTFKKYVCAQAPLLSIVHGIAQRKRLDRVSSMHLTGATRAVLPSGGFCTTYICSNSPGTRMKKLYCVQLLLFSDSLLARDLLKRLLETNMKSVEWTENCANPVCFGKNSLELWLAIRSGVPAWRVALKIRSLIGHSRVSITINGVHFVGQFALTGSHASDCCRKESCFAEGYMCCDRGHDCV